MNSDRNFGDFDRNSVIFYRKTEKKPKFRRNFTEKLNPGLESNTERKSLRPELLYLMGVLSWWKKLSFGIVAYFIVTW